MPQCTYIPFVCQKLPFVGIDRMGRQINRHQLANPLSVRNAAPVAGSLEGLTKMNGAAKCEPSFLGRQEYIRHTPARSRLARLVLIEIGRTQYLPQRTVQGWTARHGLACTPIWISTESSQPRHAVNLLVRVSALCAVLYRSLSATVPYQYHPSLAHDHAIIIPDDHMSLIRMDYLASGPSRFKTV